MIKKTRPQKVYLSIVALVAFMMVANVTVEGQQFMAGGIGINKNSLEYSVNIGSEAQDKIIVSNTGDQILELSASVSGEGMNDIIFPGEQQLEVDPGKDVELQLSVKPTKLVKPGQYTGELLLRGNGDAIIPIKVNVSGPGMQAYSPLDVERRFIEASVFQGDTANESFEVKNAGQQDVTVNARIANQIAQFVDVSDQTFLLKTGESKDITLEIAASPSAKPGVYHGDISLDYGYGQEDMTVKVDVKQPLSIDIGIEDASRKLGPNKAFPLNIAISKLNGFKPFIGKLAYMLKKPNGEFVWFKSGNGVVANMTGRVGAQGMPEQNKVVTSPEEMINVKDSMTLRRVLRLPEDAMPGTYRVKVVLVYASPEEGGQSIPMAAYDTSAGSPYVNGITPISAGTISAETPIVVVGSDKEEGPLDESAADKGFVNAEISHKIEGSGATPLIIFAAASAIILVAAYMAKRKITFPKAKSRIRASSKKINASRKNSRKR